jgi:hypothetical protein
MNFFKENQFKRKSKKSGSGTNRGFRSIDNQVYTYLQGSAGFSYFYPKRKVLADGVSTTPLDISICELMKMF